MVYYAWGVQEQSEKTLICLHGLNRNGRDWDYMAKRFASNGYYVIAPDIVGRGNSDYLLDPQGYIIPNYIKDVLQLINLLSLKQISILGTSMGGLIGMSIAAMPDNPLQKLILNDIGAEVEIEGLKNIASYSLVQPEFNNLKEAMEYLISTSLEFGNLPNDVWEHMARNSFQKNSNGKFELKRDLNLAKPFTENFSSDKNVELWDYWDKVSIPTLIIRGESSNILSNKTVDKMKATKPLTQSIQISNAGHAPFLYLDAQAEIIDKFLN